MNVSSHAHAVILLTVYFGKTDTKPLTVKEWGRLAYWLKDHNLEPSQILKEDPKFLFAGWMDKTITLQRIERLLDRGCALGIALEKWQRAGLWIITRSGPDYPKKLKDRLRLDSPPVLFGCGNKTLLNRGGIAIVGSRNADKEDIEFTTSLTQSAAEQNLSVISGGARGVDESAMFGALNNGGTVVGIMANNLLQSVTSMKYRKHLLADKLVLVSTFNPEAGFNVGNAMARNKYIYCLSDTSVVVNSTPNKGGTWNGAVENLKENWVPLWVQSKNDSASGNMALVQKKARLFPQELVTLSPLWDIISSENNIQEEPESMSFQFKTEDIVDKTSSTPVISNDTSIDKNEKSDIYLEYEDEFYTFFLQRFSDLTVDNPLDIHKIITKFGLVKSQVNMWLKRGIKSGKINKLFKPVRYKSKWNQFNIDNNSKKIASTYGDSDILRNEDVKVSFIDIPTTNNNNSLKLEFDLYNLFLQRFINLTTDEPSSIDKIIEEMKLEKSQVNKWLKRGIKNNEINKLFKPVRYESERQKSFF